MLQRDHEKIGDVWAFSEVTNVGLNALRTGMSVFAEHDVTGEKRDEGGKWTAGGGGGSTKPPHVPSRQDRGPKPAKTPSHERNEGATDAVNRVFDKELPDQDLADMAGLAPGESADIYATDAGDGVRVVGKHEVGFFQDDKGNVFGRNEDKVDSGTLQRQAAIGAKFGVKYLETADGKRIDVPGKHAEPAMGKVMGKPASALD